MTLKDPKQIIRNLFNKHLKKVDNVIYVDKLFIVNSVISYLFKDKSYRDIDKQEILKYGELINQYLLGQIDIFWQDGILMIRNSDEY